MSCKKLILPTLLLLITTSAVASPYDNLSFALRQQKIINDLRSHCQIDKAITDEKIKTTFLHTKSAEPQIIKAVTALRAEDSKTYSESIEEVQCPQIN